MLKQPAINTGDAIPVNKCVSRVPDYMKGELNEMLAEMVEAARSSVALRAMRHAAAGLPETDVDQGGFSLVLGAAQGTGATCNTSEPLDQLQAVPACTAATEPMQQGETPLAS